MTSRLGQAIVVASTSILLPCIAWADSVADARQHLADQLDAYQRHGTYSLPALSTNELQVLLDGEFLVKDSMDEFSIDGEIVNEMGIAAMQILDAPRLPVWLAAMGVASEPDIRLTRAFLEHHDAGAYVRYQHVNLPWPIRDRHWVILCEKNPQLAEASDGMVWEHFWSLVDDGESMWRNARRDGRIDGIDVQTMEKSIYLSENRGAWIMLEVEPDRTLVIAFFDGDLGGRLPKSLVRHFSHMQLRKGMQLIAEVSTEMHELYDENQPVHDGFGRPIDKQSVIEAAIGPIDRPSIAAAN